MEELDCESEFGAISDSELQSLGNKFLATISRGSFEKTSTASLSRLQNLEPNLKLGSNKGGTNSESIVEDDIEMEAFWNELDQSTLDSLLAFTETEPESLFLNKSIILCYFDKLMYRKEGLLLNNVESSISNNDSKCGVKFKEYDKGSREFKVEHRIVKNVFQTNSFKLPEIDTTIKEHKKIKLSYTPPNNYYERYHLYPTMEYCPDAIKTWIYPMNYTFRDYQFNIIQRALYENTLVSLPTGLGKTFVAAVVMYNYFRWFPEYKVIFLAPNKPLVSQQIEACYNICGINQSESIEMTGEINPTYRVDLWKTKRVFFLTPQVLNNDLINELIDPMEISCVVFDEAHRAQGNYAYVKVVEKLTENNPLVRILALSATPGERTKTQSVVTNLNIACIESRDNTSPDVKPYIFEKIINKMVVPLSSLILELSETFKSLLTPSLKNLYQKNYIWSTNPDTISWNKLVLARNNFRERKKEGWESGMVEGDFALCIIFLKQLELLKLYGITTFHSKLQEWSQPTSQPSPKYRNRILMQPKFQQLIRRMETLKAQPNYMSDYLSHPKLSCIALYLESYFISQKEHSSPDSRFSKVMVFANYREVVEEIRQTISNLEPLIRPVVFIGQSDTKFNRGLKQKEQLEVISKFKDGEYNVLISTSIGEEGLDIGEIDLIVCYDSTNSSTRRVKELFLLILNILAAKNGKNWP